MPLFLQVFLEWFKNVLEVNPLIDLDERIAASVDVAT